MTCLDPKTGQRIWEGKIGGKGIYHASPTAADGKIYCMNLEGEVVVLQAGYKFNILSRIEMGGQPSMSTIAIAYNNHNPYNSLLLVFAFVFVFTFAIISFFYNFIKFF